MLFKNIKLKNYRQYVNEDIMFDNNLTVIIALMGVGKTTLLNSISWCLHGDEMYLNKNDAIEPIYNSEIIKNYDNGDVFHVEVAITILDNKNDYINIKRIEKFCVFVDDVGNRDVKSFKKELELTRIEDNKTKIEKESEAEEFISRIIPMSIREYFFFKGEDLTSYLNKDSNNIKKAITDISQVSLLNNMIDRLEKVRDIFNSDASKLSPKLDEYNKQVNTAKKKLETVSNNYEDSKKNLEELESKVKELDTYIDSRPDALTHNKIIKDNIQLIEETKEEIENLENDFALELSKLFKLNYCRAPIKNLDSYLGDVLKSENLKLLNPYIIEDILKSGYCICDNKITNKTRAYFEKLKENTNSKTNEYQILTLIKNNTEDIDTRIKEQVYKVRDIENKIQSLRKRQEDCLKKVNDSRAKLKGHNEEEIAKAQKKREEYREQIEQFNFSLGKLQQQITDLKKSKKDYNDKFNKELEKSNLQNSLNEKIYFLNRAIAIGETCKNNIVSEIKKDIEEDTNKYFFKLMWKTNTYESVSISDDYVISVSKYGSKRNVVDSLSDGEKATLSMSFTLALQLASGFEAPIIFDRPFAKLSGKKTKKNLIKSIKELSKEKQMIFLMTTDDIMTIETEISDVKKFDLDLNEKYSRIIIKEN